MTFNSSRQSFACILYKRVGEQVFTLNDCFSQNQLISLCVGVPPHRMFSRLWTYMPLLLRVPQPTILAVNNQPQSQKSPGH